MTPLQRKLTAKLLHLAAEKFSNHGCNDFDLGELSESERAEVTQILQGVAGPEYDVDRWVDDWLLMRGLAKVLEAP